MARGKNLVSFLVCIVLGVTSCAAKHSSSADASSLLHGARSLAQDSSASCFFDYIGNYTWMQFEACQGFSDDLHIPYAFYWTLQEESGGGSRMTCAMDANYKGWVSVGVTAQNGVRKYKGSSVVIVKMNSSSPTGASFNKYLMRQMGNPVARTGSLNVTKSISKIIGDNLKAMFDVHFKEPAASLGNVTFTYGYGDVSSAFRILAPSTTQNNTNFQNLDLTAGLLPNGTALPSSSPLTFLASQ